MDQHTNWQSVLSNADLDTARLIIQLQLEDARTLAPSHNSSDTSRQLDLELASQLYRNELRTCEAHLPDRELGENLEDNDNAFQQMLEAAAFGWKYNENKNSREKVQEPAKVRPIVCTACTDEYPPDEVLQMPCSHYYCSDCLENLYESCVKDETLFPPRYCHQEFLYHRVKQMLSNRVKSMFGQKRAELETKDRTYCHVPTCSVFINLAILNGRLAQCPRCNRYTCSICKSSYHYGPCPKDESMEVLMQTAQRNEWQKCFACKRVIELRTGCNHITCVCKSHFCYVCGKQWKTCECPHWDENRLIERAEGMVNRGHVHMPDRNQLNLQEQITQAAQHLRENHECDHERFRSTGSRNAEYECEMCGNTYYNWIYQCRQCWMTICNRCRHNRL